MPNPSQEPPTTSDHIQIKIKILNPNLKPPAYAKVLIMGQSKTSEHIQFKIKMPNPSQEHPAYSKAPNEDFKDIDVLCTFKIKRESKNLDPGCIKDQ